MQIAVMRQASWLKQLLLQHITHITADLGWAPDAMEAMGAAARALLIPSQMDQSPANKQKIQIKEYKPWQNRKAKKKDRNG
ncbi:hypothetical protein [Eisenbergiella sp.]